MLGWKHGSGLGVGAVGRVKLCSPQKWVLGAGRGHCTEPADTSGPASRGSHSSSRTPSATPTSSATARWLRAPRLAPLPSPSPWSAATPGEHSALPALGALLPVCRLPRCRVLPCRRGSASSGAVQPTWIPFGSTVAHRRRLRFALDAYDRECCSPRTLWHLGGGSRHPHPPVPRVLDLPPAPAHLRAGRADQHPGVCGQRHAPAPPSLRG